MDLVNVGYGFGPAGDYSEYDRYHVAIKVPLILNEEKKDIVLLNAAINQSTVIGESSIPQYDLGGVVFNPAYFHEFEKGNSLTIMPILRWFGEEIGFQSNDFQFGGLGIWSIPLSDNYTHKFGVYANDEFFGLFVTPFYGVDWKINEKTRFSGNLPVTFTLAHQWKERVSVGIDYNGLVSSFRTSQTYIERRVLNMGPYLDFEVLKNVIFRGHAGYLIGSSFDEYAVGDQIDWSFNIIRFGDDREKISSVDVSGLFVTFSLMYRVKTDD